MSSPASDSVTVLSVLPTACPLSDRTPVRQPSHAVACSLVSAWRGAPPKAVGRGDRCLQILLRAGLDGNDNLDKKDQMREARGRPSLSPRATHQGSGCPHALRERLPGQFGGAWKAEGPLLHSNRSTVLSSTSQAVSLDALLRWVRTSAASYLNDLLW